MDEATMKIPSKRFITPGRLKTIQRYLIWATVLVVVFFHSKIQLFIQSNASHYLISNYPGYFRYPVDTNLRDVIKAVSENSTPSIPPWDFPRVEYIHVPLPKKCVTRPTSTSRYFDNQEVFRHVFVNGVQNPPDTSPEEHLLMIILIKSNIVNFKQRQLLRSTWAQEISDPLVSVRRVFLVGSPAGSGEPFQAMQDSVDRESHEHGDILQHSGMDTYRNNSLKMKAGLEWFARNCRGPQVFILTDDDYFARIFHVVPLALSLYRSGKLHSVLGYVHYKMKPHREVGDKWYISYEDYPYSVYPPFATGGFLVMNSTTAHHLSVGMSYTKPAAGIDDVWMGIVLFRLGIPLIHEPRFDPEPPGEVEEYFSRSGVKTEILAAHSFQNTSWITKMWRRYMFDIHWQISIN